MNRALIYRAIVFFLLLGGGFKSVLAQNEESTGKLNLSEPRKDFKPVKSAASSRATVSTGSLTIVAASGAAVYLESLGGKKADKRQGQIEVGSRLFIFNDLKPGRYRVFTELAGHESEKEREVTVLSGKTQGVEFSLRPITYKPTIKTNVKTGTVSYQMGSMKAISDIRNGVATLPGMPAGTYEIEISTSEAGYRTLKDKIELGAGRTDFEKNLEYRISEGILAAAWTSLDGWDVPADWKISSRILQVKSAGVGLPRNEDFRHYADFSLVSDLKMSNDLAVSLALRAQDSRNYYLIQITGGKADEPHVLRGFVVKDGILKRLQDSISVGGYANSFDGQFFELTLECVKNKFTVSINDQNGERQVLGVLTDYNNQFRVGAVGLAAHGQERMEVGRFLVTPFSPR